MDPYLLTWLSRYGAALVLCALWAVLAVRGAVRGRWSDAAVLGALSGVVSTSLWTHLGPLLGGDPLPAVSDALEVAQAAPYVAFGLLALRRARGDTGFDLIALSPLALAAEGLPAWFLAIALVGGGWLAPGQRRRALGAAMLLLVLASALDSQRMWARTTAEPHVGGRDNAVMLVNAAVSGLEGAGWFAASAWAARKDSALRRRG